MSVSTPILAVRDRVMAPLSEGERETLRDLLARVISANELKNCNSSGHRSNRGEPNG